MCCVKDIHGKVYMEKEENEGFFFFGRQEANIIRKTGQAPRVYMLYTRKEKIRPTTHKLGKTIGCTLINLQAGTPPHSSGQPKM